MPGVAARPENPVHAAVVHFLGHWPGTQKLLASRFAAELTKMEQASGSRIPGGRTEKALSSWKVGRNLPKDVRQLIALRRAARCPCEAYAGHVLDRLLRATKQAGDPKNRRRNPYLAAVRDVAPTELEDRTAEVAMIRDFCLADHPYEWWKGNPWAGKTALAAIRFGSTCGSAVAHAQRTRLGRRLRIGAPIVKRVTGANVLRGSDSANSRDIVRAAVVSTGCTE
jgi:hypothetical protein